MNLTQPILLLVVGKPGAGKSFFARQFSETFGAPVVSIDRARHAIFATPHYTNEETALLTTILTDQIEELIKTKKTVVVDGCCNARVERQRLRQLAKKAGYGVLTIWVQTDEHTCRIRATKRHTQRADDAFNGSLTSEQFDTLCKRFTAPAHEAYVVISGRHTYPAQAKTVLRVLAAPREEEATAAHLSVSHDAGAHHAARPQTRRNVIIS